MAELDATPNDVFNEELSIPFENETPQDDFYEDDQSGGDDQQQQDQPGNDASLTPERFQQLQEENRTLRQRSEVLDNFERNPEGVLRDVAGRMGLELVPKQGGQPQNGQQHNQTNSGPPREYVERLSQSLSPELQFMTEPIAQAAWMASQESIRPIQEQQTRERTSQFTRERDTIVAEMDKKYPAWRSALPEMEERFNFLREAANGGPQRHPRFGSVQEMLYTLAPGGRQGGNARRNSAERQRSAPQNATSLSTGGQGTDEAEVQKQIDNAKSDSDKFRIAFRAAMAEHGVRR